MTLRRAVPEEAEKLWQIRNLAIRAGCQSSYDAEVIDRWTPDLMPESYRQVVIDNPFFVAVDENGEPVATGYLDLAMNSVEAVFTAPNATGKGLAGAIIAAIKAEARKRGITRITLSSTISSAVRITCLAAKAASRCSPKMPQICALPSLSAR